ncbi:hypothetical protein E2562_012691 [Oryza meyeriana var. granulata]|uniref:Uncharacterized protein n=1 Tax=Oryza meyeriana var. granulata TaxID=110450 RepID=A0A6G1CFU1_9ORYZ|nr:hypothetical protein E2562_012691 [Oryza meyeriana var. granulata]
MGIESAPDDPRHHSNASDPEILEQHSHHHQSTSEAEATTAAKRKRMEMKAACKAYLEERRRTSRERMLVFDECGEAYKKRGAEPMPPPLEITKYKGMEACQLWPKYIMISLLQKSSHATKLECRML